jgi:hypothetical protein
MLLSHVVLTQAKQITFHILYFYTLDFFLLFLSLLYFCIFIYVIIIYFISTVGCQGYTQLIIYYLQLYINKPLSLIHLLITSLHFTW